MCNKVLWPLCLLWLCVNRSISLLVFVLFVVRRSFLVAIFPLHPAAFFLHAQKKDYLENDNNMIFFPFLLMHCYQSTQLRTSLLQPVKEQKMQIVTQECQTISIEYVIVWQKNLSFDQPNEKRRKYQLSYLELNCVNSFFSFSCEDVEYFCRAEFELFKFNYLNVSAII